MFKHTWISLNNCPIWRFELFCVVPFQLTRRSCSWPRNSRSSRRAASWRTSWARRGRGMLERTAGSCPDSCSTAAAREAGWNETVMTCLCLLVALWSVPRRTEISGVRVKWPFYCKIFPDFPSPLTGLCRSVVCSVAMEMAANKISKDRRWIFCLKKWIKRSVAWKQESADKQWSVCDVKSVQLIFFLPQGV